MWTEERINRLADRAHELVAAGEVEPWEALAFIIETMGRPCPEALR